MPIDHIRYDILTQDALRGMVKRILIDAAKNGLPGDHHFFITFDPRADGVRLSARMREQYPEEMTIVLQHQFWDLKVTDDALEVGLSFGGIAERLQVPFDAIKSFLDPSVQFGLQFETLVETADPQTEAKPRKGDKPMGPTLVEPIKSSVPAIPVALPPPASPPPATTSEPAEKAGNDEKPEKPSGEVVRLDRFRKK